MSTRHSVIAIVVFLSLSAPAAAETRGPGFNFLEGGFIGSFVNDLEDSGTITGNDGPLELETDAGGGGFISGAWQIGENFHVFGEYSAADQELEVRDGIDTVEGDFSVTRWRIGGGYARPISAATTVYGRLSLDNVELADVSVAGFDLEADVDDNGIGGEIGFVWAATPSIDLQGHLRYTSVGGIDSEDSDSFESDTLVGVNGRWYFRPDFALITGYEFGKITTLNVGVRFSF